MKMLKLAIIGLILLLLTENAFALLGVRDYFEEEYVEHPGSHGWPLCIMECVWPITDWWESDIPIIILGAEG